MKVRDIIFAMHPASTICINGNVTGLPQLYHGYVHDIYASLLDRIVDRIDASIVIDKAEVCVTVVGGDKV